jgi:hypothetical protein
MDEVSSEGNVGMREVEVIRWPRVTIMPTKRIDRAEFSPLRGAKHAAGRV